MTLEADIIQFAHTLERRRDRAYDLWTWLPSCKAAQECLGDYYSEIMPDMEYVMEEACSYISDLKAGRPLGSDIYGCPCQGDCPKASPEEEG